jgi:hypothetical protein
VGMLPEADTLLLLMKRHIDQPMVDEPTEEPKLQWALNWAQQKADVVNTSYTPVVVKAFYYGIAFINFHSSCFARKLDPSFEHLILELDFELDRDFTHAYQLTRELDLFLDFTPDPQLAVGLAIVLEHVKRASGKKNSELNFKVHELSAELPDPECFEVFNHWWHQNGKAWVKKLRIIMIEHRNIGHDWQFSEAQKEKLRQYYEANKLLVDCLNSDCYVTKATRQYIEDTLLLPLSEIEKYPVPDAIANL